MQKTIQKTFLLIMAPVCRWASVTISLTVKPFSCISWRHFRKPAFSRFVLFFSVSHLSNVFNDRMFLVWSSITVYVQYWAQCPGLSILPSPENQILFKKNCSHTICISIFSFLKPREETQQINGRFFFTKYN